MKRSKRVEVDRLVERLIELQSAMPAAGMTLAAFEALLLREVPPPDVLEFVCALHNRGAIFVRRNRGEMRIFAERPAEIAGVFEGPKPIDRLLSSASPYARRIAGALRALQTAKASGDPVGANAARDALEAFSARFVDLVRKHERMGLLLADARDDLWTVIHPEVMSWIASFEPALGRSATAVLAPKPILKPRIGNGLGPREKVAALIERAGSAGILKRCLYQGIRPKLRAAELEVMLEDLVSDGLVEAKEVRVRGKRFATRYVVTSIAEAA